MTTPRLRIAVLAYEFPALSETFVLNQVTGLIDRGHDVTVFADRPRAEAAVHGDVTRYDLAARTRYPRIPDGYGARLLKAVRPALRLGRQNPKRLAASLDARRFGRDAASGRLLYWGACLAQEKPFDVILAHFGPVGAFGATLREAGLVSGKLVTVMHGVDVSPHVVRAGDTYGDLFEAGDLFLPISDRWREKLERLGCAPDKLAVHRMGVDTTRYAFQPRQRPRDRPLHLLTVGRLIEKKGIADALRAVAALAAGGTPFRYAIIGDGPLRAELEALGERLGISDRVRFLGWRDQAGVSAAMRDADILLAPSVTASDGDQEGIPVTIMEAMAAGMIVLSTWHSGIPELVEHGRTGLLVEEGDSDGLAAALRALLGDDAERWPAYSHAARDKVEREFDIAVLNRHLEARFRTLVDSGR